MNKTILTLVMAVLCLFLQTSAQKMTIKPIQIGEIMPVVSITNAHNFKTPITELTQFNAKLVILDFWATWCSPCVAMIPKMDSLQKQYNGDLQFLSVTYQKAEEVTPFIQKLEKQKNIHYQIPYVTNDQVFRFIFPHKSLPHYVWIGADGIVKAITGPEDITPDNIEKIINNKALALAVKKDLTIPFDHNKLLLVNGNGGDGRQLIYHSVLSGYTEGLSSGFQVKKADQLHVNRLTFTNTPILWLYKHAYGDGYTTFFQQNRVSVEVSDPNELYSDLHGKPYADWLSKPGHGFCYELSIPQNLVDQFYPTMKKNLELLFPQYIAGVERRKVKTMALVKLKGADLIKTYHPDAKVIEEFDPFGFKIQNSTIQTLISRMQLQYQQFSKLPFTDQTGYTGRIDLSISANLTSIPDMNSALKPYHLQWIEKMVEQNILVIKDSKFSKNHNKDL